MAGDPALAETKGARRRDSRRHAVRGLAGGRVAASGIVLLLGLLRILRRKQS
jgi:hypothetical protein